MDQTFDDLQHFPNIEDHGKLPVSTSNVWNNNHQLYNHQESRQHNSQTLNDIFISKNEDAQTSIGHQNGYTGKSPNSLLPSHSSRSLSETPRHTTVSEHHNSQKSVVNGPAYVLNNVYYHIPPYVAYHHIPADVWKTFHYHQAETLRGVNQHAANADSLEFHSRLSDPSYMFWGKAESIIDMGGKERIKEINNINSLNHMIHNEGPKMVQNSHHKEISTGENSKVATQIYKMMAPSTGDEKKKNTKSTIKKS
ncbi:hypothetical protein CROQUDRAFT_101431 [Cronartium quercuum f. sp. fusiforme G11]|uniref:Uncharacterized protein n=1 Tax=Cronartium quercuum f. sp. fusiforme G11 TaxID=708437 RepID=A0A9P6T6K4_9BASI|nr:hypothetical protein CROQUDRAFT_101431 [Cronartium quercuum f. sp. fusiforme G11]